MSKIACATVLGMALMAATSVQAVPMVTIYNPATSGIDSIKVDFDDNTSTITIDETWRTTDPGYLTISGLEEFQPYIVKQVIHNDTKKDWTSVANELLAPKQGSPGSGYVPAGFTTSGDFDGLSFAQEGNIPRTSNVFHSVLEDEWSTRDFLDFKDGILVVGGIDTLSYGLTSNDANYQPFLLSQRPNTLSDQPDSPQVPEPASLALLGIGLGGLALQRYRQRRS